MSEEQQEKKVVSKNVAIALGIICIILVVGLLGAIVDYTSIINARDSQMEMLTNQKNQLQAWLDGNKTDLQNQIDTLEAPKLVAINLRAYDNRSLSGTPYFHIYGYICNVGRKPAVNPILYVEGWHEETQYPPFALAFNATISSPANATGSKFFGVIEPESFAYIDSKIYYSGSEIISGGIWSSPTGINETYFQGSLLPIGNETPLSIQEVTDIP
jgi:hypothetical protein